MERDSDRDEISDAVCENFCFSAAGAGEHELGSFDGFNCSKLSRVEILQEICVHLRRSFFFAGTLPAILICSFTLFKLVPPYTSCLSTDLSGSKML